MYLIEYLCYYNSIVCFMLYDYINKLEPYCKYYSLLIICGQNNTKLLIIEHKLLSQYTVCHNDVTATILIPFTIHQTVVKAS